MRGGGGSGVHARRAGRLSAPHPPGAGMAELDKPQREVEVPGDWTYASAPESRDIVEIADRYGHFVGGEWLEPTETYETIAPRDEEPLAAVGQATAADVGRAVAAARTAYADGWSSLPGSERAKYLFRIARILQERSREFAVLESLNGGKPIKESRDVDLPLAAAHFFYYAGWADKLEYAFPNRRPRRPDHPLELPAPHARVEGRARARLRQHGRPQAGGDDPAHGAPLLRRAAPGRAPRRRREHHHRRRPHGRGARRERGRGQDRL